MRHRKKFNHLGRQTAHRKALLSNLASSLILHKRITTTIAKAKALRIYVEPLITKSKDDSTHSRRTVFSYLQNKHAVSELFRDVAVKIADRPGGYTRILKTGFRKGDGADMCFIELVDYNTNMLKAVEETQTKRTRRGRTSGKKETDKTTAEAPKAPAADKKAPEAPAEDTKTTDTPVAQADTDTKAQQEENLPTDEPTQEEDSKKE